MGFFLQRGIRWRLALLYSGIFGLILTVFCALLFQYFQRTQLQAFDTTLYNFTVDISTNLEMDFVGRLFVVNSNVSEAGKLFPFHLGGSYLEIRDSSGKVLLHSRSLEGKALPLDQRVLARLPAEKAIFQTVPASRLGLKSSSPDLRLLTYWAHAKDWRAPLVLQVAVPLDLPHREQRDLLAFFIFTIPTFLVIAGLLGVWTSKFALKPVHDMTVKAQAITGVDKLRERIPVPEAADEIHELAKTFNDLLDRLGRAFDSQDRFISNASHQLKTPLTILKGELDLLRKRRAHGEDVAEGLESAADEINRLIRLVQDLLLLARLEAGRDSLSFGQVLLDDVLLKVVSRMQKLASVKGVQIKAMLSSESEDGELDAAVHGDEELLESMLENFVENAVKYSPANSVVELGMITRAQSVEVFVRDRGPGIPHELRQKVFERFQRASSIEPGSGLGLSIAAEIARIHRIDIDVREGQGGVGTSVGMAFRRPDSRLTADL